MEEVAIKYCPSYAISEVESSIIKLLRLLKIDLKREVGGKTVLLKPNLLGAHRPEKAVTTHPVFVEAVIRVLKDCGCKIWLGDSPNGVQKSLEDVWERTGMADVAEKYGVVKKFFERDGAMFIDDILVSRVILDADCIINIPKLKTHGLTMMTCAVKNMFGVVPGLKKTDYHRKAASKSDFAETLVRIAEVRRPFLNIVDGITAMAGNGPSGGYPVNLGLIAAGRDMHSTDLAIAAVVGFEPKHVDTLAAAWKRGLVDITEAPPLVGDDASLFDAGQLKPPVTYTLRFAHFRWFNFLIRGYMDRIRVRPRVNRKNCRLCGMCMEICPVQAIELKGSFPNVAIDKCIECYSCHEVCLHKAIDLKESTTLKIVKRLSS